MENMMYATGSAGGLLERCCNSSPLVAGLAVEQDIPPAMGSLFQYPTRLQVRNTFVHLWEEDDPRQERKIRSCPGSRLGSPSPRGCARDATLPRKDMEAGPSSRTTIYDSEGNSSAAASMDGEVSPDRDAEACFKPSPSTAKVVHPWRRDSAKKALMASSKVPESPPAAQTDDLRPQQQQPQEHRRPQQQQPQEHRRPWEAASSSSPSSSPSHLPEQKQPTYQQQPLLSSTPINSNQPPPYMLLHHGGAAPFDDSGVYVESSLTHWQGVEQSVYKLSLNHGSLQGVFQCPEFIVAETAFGLSDPSTNSGHIEPRADSQEAVALSASVPPASGCRAVAGASASSQTEEASDMSTVFPEDIASKGSSLHASGKCRPCAFLHTKGCENGLNCEFCHLCEPGEKKKRRKEKLESQRDYRKVRNMPTGQSQQRELQR